MAKFFSIGTTGTGEYSMEKIKMSYDKLDFSRPAENLKPHYHSSSTLRSSKSKEFSKPTTASSARCQFCDRIDTRIKLEVVIVRLIICNFHETEIL